MPNGTQEANSSIRPQSYKSDWQISFLMIKYQNGVSK